MAFSEVERFALVDVDGLFLDNPGDELTIPEPIGFSEFKRVIERDDRFFGFTAEYGAASGDLGNDWNKAEGATYSAHELLDYFITNVGIDSKVLLRYYRTTGGIETLDTEWNVVINEDVEQIDSTINLLVERQDWDNKFRSRIDVDVNLESTTDLDDNASTALSLIEVPLHSKAIILGYEADYVKAYEQTSDVFELIGSSGTGAYISIGPINIIQNEINFESFGGFDYDSEKNTFVQKSIFRYYNI